MNHISVTETSVIQCTIERRGTSGIMDCFICGNKIPPDTRHECDGEKYTNTALEAMRFLKCSNKPQSKGGCASR